MALVGRTNIDIDEALIGRVMERYGLPSKRAAVDFALRRAVDAIEPMTAEEALAMEGVGWGEDGLELSDLRDGTPVRDL
jgi:Arc/MetJ family transcription regulator